MNERSFSNNLDIIFIDVKRNSVSVLSTLLLMLLAVWLCLCLSLCLSVSLSLSVCLSPSVHVVLFFIHSFHLKHLNCAVNYLFLSFYFCLHAHKCSLLLCFHVAVLGTGVTFA